MPTKIKELQVHECPTAYGYGRVSHHKGYEKGDSIESQHIRITTYYEHKLLDEGIEWGGSIDDGTNVSAYKIPFHLRPAGRKLISVLNPGDHLIIDKVDRIWRNMKDFIYLMEMMENRNVALHIVNFLGSSIQNNTPMGRHQLQQFVMMSELESSIKSERTREALNVIRKKGQRFANFVPPGCRVVKRTRRGKVVSFLEWDEVQRSIMAEIVRLRDDERLTWSKSYKLIEEFHAKAEGRKVRKRKDQNHWRNTEWPRMYRYETAYRYLGIVDPSQIPVAKIIEEAARQSRRVRTTKKAKEFAKRTGRKHAYPKSEIEVIDPDQLLALY